MAIGGAPETTPFRQAQEWQSAPGLSGCYRVSRNEPDFPDAGQIVRALIAANSDRLVWGTDWPHTASDGHVHGSEQVPMRRGPGPRLPARVHALVDRLLPSFILSK
jgi:hypothetical protein